MRASFNLLRHRFVRIYQSYFPTGLSRDEHLEIKKRFSGELVALFYSQPLCDQRHGLLVYRKCKEIFRETDIEDDELFVAACFHDYAKTLCRFNVTQRVIVAMLLGFIPFEKHETLRLSRFKIFRRIGIYADHARLSWDAIEPYCKSDFVRNVTQYHHGYPKNIEVNDRVRNYVDMFIAADTL